MGADPQSLDMLPAAVWAAQPTPVALKISSSILLLNRVVRISAWSLSPKIWSKVVMLPAR